MMLKFLTPSVAKILLTFAVLIISSILWRMFVLSRISDTFPMGFPLQFYLAWGPCQAGEICSESSAGFLILDVLFWYVVSAFVINRLGRKINAHA
jgi:hypothetical protein